MSKQIWRLTLIVLQELVIILVSGNMILASRRPPDLAVTTAKLIKSCYDERVKDIGLSGDISNSFVASFYQDNPFCVVLLKSEKNKEHYVVVPKKDRYKLQIFAIPVKTSVELQENLVHIKNSRWWNHMAQFYIFDSGSNGMGCSEASAFLWTAWMMDVLGAKFICNYGIKGQLIYAFNPYTQYAPPPWKIERILKGVNDHPWTLLVRKFHANPNICDNIDFDQTRDAGGYQIRFTRSRNRTFPNPTSFGEFSKLEFADKWLHTISHHMNVTFNAVYHLPNDSALGFVDKDGKGYGMLRDVTNDRSDIVFWPWPLAAMAELLGNYPILYGPIFAVTQYTGYQSQWEKIITVVDYSSRIGVCIVTVVNVILLKYLLRQSFMIAILNTMRMICNSCFTKLPNNTGPRLYLAGLFIFVVTMQGIFSGELSARLAKQVRYPNVNNAKDLIKSHHIIHGRYNDNLIFTDPAFEGRFIGINHRVNKCTNFVLANSANACVGVRDMLINDAIESKLHVSKFPVAETPTTWPNRRNWPLEDRFTRHNFYYAESGLFDYHQELTYADAFRTLDANENEAGDLDFKVLTPADLDFAFVIFAFGLGCATLTLVIEILIFRRRRLSQVCGRVRYRHKNRVISIKA